jgi:uncharacterized protein
MVGKSALELGSSAKPVDVVTDPCFDTAAHCAGRHGRGRGRVWNRLTSLCVLLLLPCVGATAQPAPQPSFNCAKVQTPDEIAICTNVELSQIDNAVAAGYQYLRRVSGDLLAKQTGMPLFQARRQCGSDVSCIKQRQFDAVKKYHELGAPVNVSLWVLNNSTMTLVANGSSRSFFYETPSPEAADEGAKTGSLSFEGQIINGQYVGIAYAFDSRCGQTPYKVSGPISDNYLSVVLQGLVPRFGLNCVAQAYSNESLEFKLLNSGSNGFPLDLSPNAVTSPNSPAGTVAIRTPNVSPTSTLPSETGSSILVSLQKEGRGYVVPVLINNAITLNFVIDSGADDVSIPADVVLTLVRTGTLTEADFIGNVTYRLADGSKVPSKTFRINSLTVGTKKIEGVIGSIAPVEGSLLLGQSFLGRFSSWSIDNAKQSLVLRW